MKEGGSVTESRVYKRALADMLVDLKAGRFVPSTADGPEKAPRIEARPSKARGKARRRKANAR